MMNNQDDLHEHFSKFFGFHEKEEIKKPPKFTQEQAIIITGYTGVVACDFADFHQDVERRIGTAVFTHQFGDAVFANEIKQLYKEDFIAPIQK